MDYRLMLLLVFFFFKQKTAYEMRISDWSSDVCSSDLWPVDSAVGPPAGFRRGRSEGDRSARCDGHTASTRSRLRAVHPAPHHRSPRGRPAPTLRLCRYGRGGSEEHTSEPQSLKRNSHAGFCVKKKI